MLRFDIGGWPHPQETAESGCQVGIYFYFRNSKIINKNLKIKTP